MQGLQFFGPAQGRFDVRAEIGVADVLVELRGAHHRGDKCGVRLDRLGDVRRRWRLALTETDEAPTRFQEGRHLGNCVEGVCEAPASDPGTAVTRTRALCVECLAHRRFRALRRVRSHASTP